MANNIKKFLCTFSNGMQAIMGADSAKDAMEAATMMQSLARAHIVDVKEVKEPFMPYNEEYFMNILGNNPMLNAGNNDIEPDPDFF